MKTLKVPIYDVEIKVSFCRDELSRKGIEIESFHAAEVSRCEEYSNGITSTYILMFFQPEEYSTNTLCHESIHAAWRVLEFVGIEVDKDNHEALAYLAGWISQRVNNHYFKLKEKGKIK